MLVAYCGKPNASLWRPCVRLSVSLLLTGLARRILNVTHQGAARVTRTDILICLALFRDLVAERSQL